MKRALVAIVASCLMMGLLRSAEAQETVLRFEGRVI
jgi:hypothetical protein